MERIAITIEKDLLDKIDRAAGDVPRSRFISRILREWLEKGGYNAPHIPPGYPKVFQKK